MWKILLIFTSFVLLQLTQSKLTKFVSWKQLKFRDNLDPDTKENITIPYNNIPFGIAVHKNRLFVGVARRRPGVPSTLNYVDLNDESDEPELISYPNFEMNKLSKQSNYDKIVSVYRPRVDICERLWVVDTGMLEYEPEALSFPSISIFNLRTDQIIKKYLFPFKLSENGRGLSSITVDVVSDKNSCENTFAYIPDWQYNRLWVYSFQDNRAWAFQHNYFHFDPLEGHFNVNGLQFDWNDGIFSVALGKVDDRGFRTAYFHPMCSFGEFTVSTEVLRNEQLSQRSYHGNDFKFLGTRGPRTQSGSHFYDEKSGVMFFAELQLNALSCWNSKLLFNRVNFDVIEQHDDLMYYPTDLVIDSKSDIWILANKLPKYIYSDLNVNEENFFIWHGKVNKLINGTKCANNRHISPEDQIVFMND